MRWLLLCALCVAGCGRLGFDAVETDAAPSEDGDAPFDELGTDACAVVEVDAYGATTCARMDNGDVWCWGRNTRGQVGRAAQSTCESGSACNPDPERVVRQAGSAAMRALRVGLGELHGCAIASDATLCWGANTDGQFGDATSDAPMPIPVAQRAGATSIVGGDRHTCSLHGTDVRCSGANTHGEVGNNTTAPALMPVTLPFAATAIGSGYQHACAVSASSVHCWGANTDGAIDPPGVGGADVLAPRAVTGIANALAVTAGLGHTCALLADRSVRCWGANDGGQLGIGTQAPRTGLRQPAVSEVVELVAGVNHTCVRTTAGEVLCWGEVVDRSSPTSITLPRPARSIAAGSYHECAALDDGSLYCWGSNNFGQLGAGTVFVDEPTPIQVSLCP